MCVCVCKMGCVKTDMSVSVCVCKMGCVKTDMNVSVCVFLLANSMSGQRTFLKVLVIWRHLEVHLMLGSN